MDAQTWLPALTGLLGVGLGGGIQILANRQVISATERQAAAVREQSRHDALATERDATYTALLEDVHAVHDHLARRLLDNAEYGAIDGPPLDDLALVAAQQDTVAPIVAALRRAQPKTTPAVAVQVEVCVKYICVLVDSVGNGGTYVDGWVDGRTPIDVLDRLIPFELRLWRQERSLSEAGIAEATARERVRLLREVEDPESLEFS